MGYSFIGIVSNEFTPEEIMTLPEKLNAARPLGADNEDWKWVMEVSPDFLRSFWLRTEQWYSDELANKKYDEIYRYPSIESGWWGIYFQEPQITIISFPFKNGPGTLAGIDTEPELIEFLNAAIRVAKVLKADKMVLSYELGNGNTHEEKNHVDFGTLDNLINSFTKADRGFKLVEF